MQGQQGAASCARCRRRARRPPAAQRGARNSCSTRGDHECPSSARVWGMSCIGTKPPTRHPHARRHSSARAARRALGLAGLAAASLSARSAASVHEREWRLRQPRHVCPRPFGRRLHLASSSSSVPSRQRAAGGTRARDARERGEQVAQRPRGSPVLIGRECASISPRRREGAHDTPPPTGARERCSSRLQPRTACRRASTVRGNCDCCVKGLSRPRGRLPSTTPTTSPADAAESRHTEFCCRERDAARGSSAAIAARWRRAGSAAVPLVDEQAAAGGGAQADDLGDGCALGVRPVGAASNGAPRYARGALLETPAPPAPIVCLEAEGAATRVGVDGARAAEAAPQPRTTTTPRRATLHRRRRHHAAPRAHRAARRGRIAFNGCSGLARCRDCRPADGGACANRTALRGAFGAAALRPMATGGRWARAKSGSRRWRLRARRAAARSEEERASERAVRAAAT